MVSLSVVEALAADAWPSTITVAVALPDARKGERIVLLTTDAKATREQFLAAARAAGANELAVPAEIITVGAVPLLGSGKPDFIAALELARSRARLQSADAGLVPAA